MRTLFAAAAAWAVLSVGALAAPVSTDPAAVPAGTYVLDDKHTSLTLKVLHLGFSRYTMRFDEMAGGFTYDPAAWRSASVRIEVDAESIDAGSAAFDKEVAGFFNAVKHPKIVFVSRGFEAVEGASAKLVGDLTLNGVTKPVTLDVTFNGVGPGMMGGTRLGFSGSGRIKRSEFGVDSYSKYVGDDVDMLIEVEFYKK